MAILVQEALKNGDIHGSISIIGSQKLIEAAGIKELPALVVDNHVLISGRVPSYKELIDLLKNTT